ncbi:hybrid sensor histidine kinase/response regulator [Spirulina sp. CS-785/01]|uniref:hybrid sensor histidine kinase/response regulator n=1 Tax=Spirulina sp. CS-785/01 TaxID=3021716 RepID=UPI00232C6B73|nr:hybrid sensor histidine kinase/response regulator [Spirulina sp. CS-785/01]MDB9312359.1 hybrid sensor histidine kinase/response regulator [Spirulina sp. CS-785/01]
MYILAVDDAPDNLLLVQLALEQEGYDIEMVDNGQDALKKIDETPPNLVLLDVMMPEMDGYEVTRRIRKNPNLPYILILLITAHEHPSVVKGLDVGADEFIRKPVKVSELQARVRSLLRLKKSIDQRENFVHCLTHDLRTPLVAANRMLQVIQQGAFGETTPKMEEALLTVVSNNDNLLKMLNNLLEVYCYDVGQKILSFREFNLAELLEEVVSELKPLAESQNLELRSQFDSDLNVTGDRMELRRVFSNLISNGIKFTDEGHVEVRSQEISSPETPVEEQKIQVEIEDTGVGISEEDQKRIFQEFRQGTNKRSGHGLGLHLCRQIINTHQGQLEVKSQLGQGTTFTLTLPVHIAQN